MKNTATVILAAGKGKRMKSDLPKVLHKMLGRPMIEHLLETIRTLAIDRTVVVVGHQADMVQEILSKIDDSLDFVLQVEQKGTGHATLMTEDCLSDFTGDILVMAGDVPFLSAATIENLVAVHRGQEAAATVLSAIPPDPTGYGRVIRIPGTDLVDRIVEHKDATDEEKQVDEINSGTFCFNSRYLFKALHKIKSENSQNEYYLTDVMQILRQEGHKTAVCRAENADEVLGVNSVEQLADLETKFAKKTGLNEPSRH